MKEKLSDILNNGCLAVFVLGVLAVIIWTIASNIKGVLILALLVLAAWALLWIIDQIYMVYKNHRRKNNKPYIGEVDFPLTKLLKRDDYVSIGGRVLRFSHISEGGESIDILRPPLNDNLTIGGELAFDNPRGLGYIMYYPSALKKCEFIYGEYGVKWAASEELAASAEEMVDKAILDL